MTHPRTTRQRTQACLERFLTSVARQHGPINDNTDLHRDLGFASDEGLDFVLELCDEFSYEFPNDFNPVVHDSGTRGRKFGELVVILDTYMRQRASA